MTRRSERLSVRPFHYGEREALQRLWARVFPDDPPWNAPEVMIENKLKVQPELLLVGKVDGTLVGAVIAGFDGVRGWIYHLAIAPPSIAGADSLLSWCVQRRTACAGSAVRKSIFRSVQSIMRSSRSIEALDTRLRSA